MVWPLKNALPDGYEHWTVGELREIIAELEASGRPIGDEPVWIDNYKQFRSITQRPVELAYVDVDGLHLG